MRVLPFAAYIDGAGSCPPALEAGLVLATVETRRGKGTGFVLTRRDAEKVKWVSRFTWPFLAVPTRMPLASLSDESDHAGDRTEDTTRYLIFDSTGLTSGEIPPFQHREGLDTPSGWGARLLVQDFIAFVDRRRDGLRRPRKPSLLNPLNWRREVAAAADKVAALVPGERQVAQDLAGHASDHPLGEWDGVPLPSILDPADAERAALEVDERLRAYLAQAAKVDEMARRLAAEAEVYPPELAETRERVAANYNAQLGVLKPQVEEAIGSHQRSLEDKLGELDSQYSSSLASLEAELTRAFNEEERWRSLGRDYEPQLAEARKTRQQAQRALDAATREKDAALRQAREHFRELVAAENDKLNTLIRARDREVQGLQDLDNRLKQALSELKAAADDASGHDRAAAAELAALTVDIGVPERAAPLEFGLPMYIARLEGRRPRHVVLMPLAVRRSRSVGQMVTGLIGALTLPAELRSPRYDHDLGKALAAALDAETPEAGQMRVAAAVSASAGSSNVLADPKFRGLASEGLAVLREEKWLNDKQHAELRQAVDEMYAGRE
jgi:hypothetical protein